MFQGVLIVHIALETFSSLKISILFTSKIVITKTSSVYEYFMKEGEYKAIQC